jgi:hypothetical protein
MLINAGVDVTLGQCVFHSICMILGPAVEAANLHMVIGDTTDVELPIWMTALCFLQGVRVKLQITCGAESDPRF